MERRSPDRYEPVKSHRQAESVFGAPAAGSSCPAQPGICIEAVAAGMDAVDVRELIAKS
jgi:hypothetical protein